MLFIELFKVAQRVIKMSSVFTKVIIAICDKLKGHLGTACHEDLIQLVLLLFR